jgi:ribosomal protein L11 methyltransferase
VSAAGGTPGGRALVLARDGENPRVIRLAIRVRRADAEVVLAELLELVPAGLEERELEHGVTEYAIYGAPGELPALPELRARVGGALVEVSTSELPDDWPERWKRFHHPVLVEPPAAGAAAPLHVRAPWLERADRADVIDIVIDPGQAFGTGAHATTRLCLQLLLEIAASGVRAPVLDVGTGSGVLAIAASLLGFTPVSAFDVEQASVDAALENAARNHAQVSVRRLDLRRGLEPWREAPIVLANLVRPVLLELAAALPAAPAQLIVGGLLAREVDELVDAYAARFSLRERERRLTDGWAAVWMTVPAGGS